MPNSQTQLAQWHEAIATKNDALLLDLLAEDVELSSPVFWRPKQGKTQVQLILKTVIRVFEDFSYHRQWINDSSWSLEFSARVADKALKGIDLIELNNEGKIIRLEVFIRPLNALQVFALAMNERLKAQESNA